MTFNNKQRNITSYYFGCNILNYLRHHDMAITPQVLTHALKSNNNDLTLVRRLLKEALHTLEESPAYQEVSAASSAADLPSLSQSQRLTRLLTPRGGPFYVAGGDVFGHGARRVTHDHLTKLCVELMHQWRTPEKQVIKYWSSFKQTLVEGNEDIFPSTTASSSSPPLGTKRAGPVSQNKSSPKPRSWSPSSYRWSTSQVLTLVGGLEVADVHVFAQTSAHFVFTNHLDQHVHTQLALNAIVGVLGVSTGAFVDVPLACGGMMIDTVICQNTNSSGPFYIQNGASFPLRQTGDDALFRGSTHVHRILSPPGGFVVYRLVIFLKLVADTHGLVIYVCWLEIHFVYIITIIDIIGYPYWSRFKTNIRKLGHTPSTL